MRCLQPLVLVCALLSGCLATRTGVVVSNYETAEPSSSAGEPGGIALYVALAERPVGDRCLNHGLWEFTDEQTPFQHDIDRKLVLDQNGFRVGIQGGIPTPDMENLLSSRCCPNPRCIRLQPGTPTTIDIGEIWPQCDFQVLHKGQPHPVSLEQAQCRLEILPHLDGDNKVRLVVTPQVRHGQQLVLPRPVQDPDGSRRWDTQIRHPEETYPWMNWTVTLDPNESLVIGGRMDRTTSLGRRMFLYTETKTPVQRVLIVRALRQGPPPAVERPKDAVIPLAAQAQATPTTRVRSVAPND